MSKLALVGLSLAFSGTALACPGKSTMTAEAEAAPAKAAHADVDPTACAKKADLVGSSCSYTTGMMAQRVVAEGADYSFTGTLASTDGKLASHVAAPFTVGPAKDVFVVANQVVEQLTDAGAQNGRVTIEGKLLEVDGVKYLVLTSFAASQA